MAIPPDAPLGSPPRPDPRQASPTGRRPLARVVGPIQAFFRLEAASGLLLLACAVVALAWANVAPASYRALFSAELALPFGARPSPVEIVNDGLMAFFFAVVGMEIKGELVEGELRTLRQALLPAVAAAGGMLVPASIYALLNRGGPGAAGWGIPMATDIAFCIGVLTLLGPRVPRALVVFVTALAIFDDIGGILVIALFYGGGLHAAWLLLAAAGAGGAVLMSRARVASGLAWLAVGALLWWALHRAGIHPTIAGVVVGLSIPARPPAPGDGGSPLDRFVGALHPWVAFGIVPLFALANSGVSLAAMDPSRLAGPVALGTAAALLVGKPAGVFLFTAVAIRLGLAPMPGGASHAKLLGVSIVAGIGFTVALFIAGLAFPAAPALLDEAKLGILAGSLASGVVGAIVLRATPSSPTPPRSRP